MHALCQKASVKISFMLFIILLDQWTKIWAVKSVKGAPTQSYLGDLFRLEYAENSGAFLSFGSTMNVETRFWIFTVGVSLFLLFPAYYLFKEKSTSWVQPMAMAGVVAGGIGNLIDRIFRPNHVVVDFMNMGIGSLRTGIFNVADMAILFGVIALFFVMGKQQQLPEKKS